MESNFVVWLDGPMASCKCIFKTASTSFGTCDDDSKCWRLCTSTTWFSVYTRKYKTIKLDAFPTKNISKIIYARADNEKTNMCFIFRQMNIWTCVATKMHRFGDSKWNERMKEKRKTSILVGKTKKKNDELRFVYSCGLIESSRLVIWRFTVEIFVWNLCTEAMPLLHFVLHECNWSMWYVQFYAGFVIHLITAIHSRENHSQMHDNIKKKTIHHAWDELVSVFAHHNKNNKQNDVSTNGMVCLCASHCETTKIQPKSGETKAMSWFLRRRKISNAFKVRKRTKITMNCTLRSLIDGGFFYF